MLIFLFFSLTYCQNILKNPSFEEVDSNNKLLNWNIAPEVELSSISYSGKKALHWKMTNKHISNSQMIKVDKGYQYEICVQLKLVDLPRFGVGFCIESINKTVGTFEFYRSRGYSGTFDWKKLCHMTGIIQKHNGDLDQYYFAMYTLANTQTGDVYVDDITVRRINFRIGINNDRDEAYDKVNVVYQINANPDNYTLSDFELTTRIKDNNNKIFCENKNIKISSLFFTKSMDIKKCGLKENNFYQVESILKNKKENTTDFSSYTFKKINKIKRNVIIDEYGRMFVNGELFFPFGVYSLNAGESDLMLLNRTHMNIIKPGNQLNKDQLDMIH